jgi:hypothetical protein
MILTYYVYRSRESVDRREFVEDFRHGLDEWEFRGNWRTDRDGKERILIVTESGDGGIAKPCRLWTDYVFRFETKIVKANTSWIIRASDVLNYVMLQCEPGALNPHFRVAGTWITLGSIPLTPPLPLNTWFDVQIRVTGHRVVVTVTEDGVERELLNDYLLTPRQATITLPGKPPQIRDVTLSYPAGSVGFREWSSKECAHFRKVRVRKI